MKAFVVTLMDMPESVEVADRCIASARKYGITVLKVMATTKDTSLAAAKERNLKFRQWDTQWSEIEPVVGNFISQYKLWCLCALLEENMLILEHDAVFTKTIPEFEFDSIITIGIPSYGSNIKKKPGVHKTFSKAGGYLPGAHAYIIKPKGATKLIKVAKEKGILPVDIFLNNKDFPELEELSPGVVRADDSFTTIQKAAGCKAKHNYSEDFKILS